MNLVGREKEVKELLDLYNTNNSDLVAIYGRRRVGKTYLINQTFDNNFDFKHAGISPNEIDNSKNILKQQLSQFYNSLKLYGMKEHTIPKDWFEAFYMLSKLLKDKYADRKQVVFIDELPWMDTPKSNFIKAFEGFWNSFANGRNIMVIICGSANSWIVNELINNHGGLYGRVTKEIKLSPLSLKECELFFNKKNINFSRYDIVQAYMAVGGIPYYLNYFEPRLGIYENIDKIFFSKSAPLRVEYDRLFASVFSNSNLAKKIVELLSTKNIGYTREEIVKKLSIDNNKTTGDTLNALLSSDFVIKFRPLTENRKTLYYKLIDPFCIFYMKFIKDSTSLDIDLFSNESLSQKVVTYRGIAFENVCFNHIEQIKNALKISAIRTSQSTFIYKGDKDTQGAQIDLIIERSDNIINLCEIKFYSNEYTNTKEKHLSLMNKKDALSKFILKKQIIKNVLITTYGIKQNEYQWDYDKIIILDELFL